MTALDYPLPLPAVTVQAGFQGVDLIPTDGTFETYSAGNWLVSGGTLAQSSAQAHGGTFSGLLTVAGSPAQAYLRPAVSAAVTPGGWYTASMWVYTSYGTVSGVIDWATSLGVHLSSASQVWAVPSNTWTLITVGGFAPATAFQSQGNLAGYEYGHGPGGPNRHTFGGLTDAGFRMIPLIEAGKRADWPWLPGVPSAV